MSKKPPTRSRAFETRRRAYVIQGHRRAPWRDLYHLLLRAPWSLTLLCIALVFVALNLLFAAAYVWSDGIANARPGDYGDAFFFSVQTMGTIGYGAMHPQSFSANVLVVIEVLAGLLLMAMGTGLVFAKFSVPQARVLYAQRALVTSIDGVPHLVFRVANERGNQVVEAHMHVVLIRRERSREGQELFRMIDLPLLRDRSPVFARTWTVMHRIDDQSPLHGHDEASFLREDSEIVATLVGMDSTIMQSIHARHSYLAEEIVWGARYADVIERLPDGRISLDYRHFHRFDDEDASSAARSLRTSK